MSSVNWSPYFTKGGRLKRSSYAASRLAYYGSAESASNYWDGWWKDKAGQGGSTQEPSSNQWARALEEARRFEQEADSQRLRPAETKDSSLSYLSAYFNGFGNMIGLRDGSQPGVAPQPGYNQAPSWQEKEPEGLSSFSTTSSNSSGHEQHQQAALQQQAQGQLPANTDEAFCHQTNPIYAAFTAMAGLPQSNDGSYPPSPAKIG